MELDQNPHRRGDRRLRRPRASGERVAAVSRSAPGGEPGTLRAASAARPPGMRATLCAAKRRVKCSPLREFRAGFGMAR